METWKSVSGYEGLYEVSNLGNIRNAKTGLVRKPTLDRYGYARVNLAKNGKSKTVWVHRIVASTFIPNELNLPQVNHIDENKTNNVADNLEWCTALYNTMYGTGQIRSIEKMSYKERAARAAKANSKQVTQYDKDGNAVAVFRSSVEAQKITGIHNSSIRACCTGKIKTAGGYRWVQTASKGVNV